jgi:drug/metabolite transporter (DMT)-like permease
MLGALVAILAAVAFSLSDVTVRRGVTRAPVAYGAIVTVLLGVPLFFIACIATGQVFKVSELSASSYGLLASAGIVHYVVGRYFNYAALEAIGAARTGPIHTLGLPYSVLIAFLFLDESITAGMIAGIVLIMIGPVIMVERRQKAPVASVPGPAVPTPSEHSPQDGFQLRQAEGYLFAIIAAVSYGSSPVLIRSALEGESGVSLLGGLISYIAAAGLLIASFLLPSRRPLLKALEPASVRLFFAPGFFVFMAQLFRFVALSLASVAVVATLLRFTTIFTLAMSWFMNRDLEKITWRVIIGVLISLAGAVILVLSSV